MPAYRCRGRHTPVTEADQAAVRESQATERARFQQRAAVRRKRTRTAEGVVDCSSRKPSSSKHSSSLTAETSSPHKETALTGAAAQKAAGHPEPAGWEQEVVGAESRPTCTS